MGLLERAKFGKTSWLAGINRYEFYKITIYCNKTDFNAFAVSTKKSDN
jgi:hypothetical protein